MAFYVYWLSKDLNLMFSCYLEHVILYLFI